MYLMTLIQIVLQNFTTRIYQEHFSQFNCQNDIKDVLRGVAGRVLEVYVRHVCMVRPLSEGGKMKITSDMSQVRTYVYLYNAYVM